MMNPTVQHLLLDVPLAVGAVVDAAPSYAPLWLVVDCDAAHLANSLHFHVTHSTMCHRMTPSGDLVKPVIVIVGDLNDENVTVIHHDHGGDILLCQESGVVRLSSHCFHCENQSNYYHYHYRILCHYRYQKTNHCHCPLNHG